LRRLGLASIQYCQRYLGRTAYGYNISTAHEPTEAEAAMGSKDKGGREVRKPKATKKPKGVVVPSSSAIPPSTHGKDQPAK
jgi:hypothetical protein